MFACMYITPPKEFDHGSSGPRSGVPEPEDRLVNFLGCRKGNYLSLNHDGIGVSKYAICGNRYICTLYIYTHIYI